MSKHDMPRARKDSQSRREEAKAGMHGQSLPSSGAADGEVPLRVYNSLWRRDSDTSFYQTKRVCACV